MYKAGKVVRSIIYWYGGELQIDDLLVQDG